MPSRIRIKKLSDWCPRWGILCFSANVAESFPRKIYGIKEPILENVVINNHGVGYLRGELPVYRLHFKGHASEEFHVSPVNARVLKYTIYMKISNIASMLHTFTPIQLLTGSDLLHWISVLFVGLIFLVGTITGIYLTFPKCKNRRSIYWRHDHQDDHDIRLFRLENRWLRC